MSSGTVAGIWTFMALVAFIGIFLWAYSSRRKSDFNEAANLPFADDDELARKNSTENDSADRSTD